MQSRKKKILDRKSLFFFSLSNKRLILRRQQNVQKWNIQTNKKLQSMHVSICYLCLIKLLSFSPDDENKMRRNHRNYNHFVLQVHPSRWTNFFFVFIVFHNSLSPVCFTVNVKCTGHFIHVYGPIQWIIQDILHFFECDNFKWWSVRNVVISFLSENLSIITFQQLASNR